MNGSFHNENRISAQFTNLMIYIQLFDKIQDGRRPGKTPDSITIGNWSEFKKK